MEICQPANADEAEVTSINGLIGDVFLVAGTNITITTLGQNITISSSGGTSSPLTTKGDLYTFTTTNARLGIGTAGQILSVDATQPTGLKWINNTTSSITGSGANHQITFWTSATNISGNNNFTYNPTDSYLGGSNLLKFTGVSSGGSNNSVIQFFNTGANVSTKFIELGGSEFDWVLIDESSGNVVNAINLNYDSENEYSSGKAEPLGDNPNARHVFYISNTEVARIDYRGYLGVGTPVPTSPITVLGDATSEPVFSVTSNTTSGALGVFAAFGDFIAGATNTQFVLHGYTDPNKQLSMGFDTSSNIGLIDPSYQGKTSGMPLQLSYTGTVYTASSSYAVPTNIVDAGSSDSHVTDALGNPLLSGDLYNLSPLGINSGNSRWANITDFGITGINGYGWTTIANASISPNGTAVFYDGAYKLGINDVIFTVPRNFFVNSSNTVNISGLTVDIISTISNISFDTASDINLNASAGSVNMTSGGIFNINGSGTANWNFSGVPEIILSVSDIADSIGSAGGANTIFTSLGGSGAGTKWQTAGALGLGTVTSVSGSGGTTGLTLTGGAITTSGTLTLGGTLGVANGGTNITSYAVGDLLYASGSTTLSKLSDIAIGNALISGGVTTAPSWGKIGLTTHISGVLPVANGGTGSSSALGIPLIVGNDRKTGLTATQALATFTVPASDTSYQISANVNVTAFAVGTFNVQVAYTDETNTAQTLKLNFSSVTGTIGLTIAATGPFEGIEAHIRCKASTTIIVSSVGTFTSLTYNMEERIVQL